VAGGTRKGWEASARLPTLLRGLSLQGSYQTWDEAWPYLPKQSYQGAFVYHRTFLETGNFEWWWSLGVRGRDPMTVRILAADAGDPPARQIEAPGIDPAGNSGAELVAKVGLKEMVAPYSDMIRSQTSGRRAKAVLAR